MVSFLPGGEYDHCPTIICVYMIIGVGKNPSRFSHVEYRSWVHGDCEVSLGEARARVFNVFYYPKVEMYEGGS